MPSWRLSLAAADDLFAIYVQGEALFGTAQADRYYDGLADTFSFLADFPWAARERTEIEPPVRAFPYKAHLVVYEFHDEGVVTILRVRHGREDWLSQ